jgi:murein DD-endopeptidase MepM/ murein hydrolase activator NlpD
LSIALIRRISLAVALSCLVVPATAVAGNGTGGAAVPDEPEVVAAICEDETQWQCARGARLTLAGDSLDTVTRVRFVGGPGRRDDRFARPRAARRNELQVVVPRTAKSGPLAVIGETGKDVAPQPLKVKRQATLPRATALPAEGVFPVQGRHTYGDGMGAGRGHEGQDVFARCGTPLVALFDATVQHRAVHDRAGYYVVLQTPDGSSFAYMHLQAPSELRKGDIVRAGDPVGKVGDTGRASGCHLHFEQWSAPGWYEGGKAIDPLPLLKSLDK